MGEDTFSDLDAPGSYAALGKLVGVTKQAIQKKANDIGLASGQTIREWLLAYCEYQREIASGRHGDSNATLTSQRIEESKQKTLSLTLDNMVRINLLVPNEDVVFAFDELINSLKTSHKDLGRKIIESINSKHNIELEDETVFKHIDAALASVAKNAGQLGDSFKDRFEESNT